MANAGWKFENVSGSSITNRVLSFSITQGRTKYLDDYAGGRLVLTLNNNNGMVPSSLYRYGQRIAVTNDVGSIFYFYIQNIDYNDYPGSTGLSTATLTAVDVLGLQGRIQTYSLALTQNNTGLQAAQVGTAYSSIATFNASFVGASIASASTYTGTVLNRLNLLNATERGFIYVMQNGIQMWSRNYMPGADAGLNFGRTATASQIGYQSLRRIQNGVSFINRVTVLPEGLASQTVSNFNGYEPSFYSSTTVDYDTTQAYNNASWVAQAMGDPNDLRFEIEFTESSQTNDAIYNLLLWWTPSYGIRTTNLTYLPPSGSSTTVPVIMEGFTISGTPGDRTYSLSFSPLQYYQFFTLDSTTLGILNTSRLGW